MNTLSTWLASLPREWTEGCDTQAFEVARAAYQSPKRRYHTWDHIVACVDRLKTFPCENPRVVFLALVFHDAIYVPGSTDNERESAVLARETLSALCSITALEIHSIERMILATRDHHAQASTLSANDTAMLDIDLSILAASREDYARYAREIRDEYVPAAATPARFRIGRLEFLHRMLSMPHVFLTAEAQRRWDDAARANMAWEVAELTAEQGLLERGISAIRNKL